MRSDTERLEWSKEKSQLQEELASLKSELASQTRRLEELQQTNAKKQASTYFIELESLTESLAATVDKLRSREGTLLEEISTLRENNARLSVESQRLKDATHRSEWDLQSSKLEHEKMVKQMQAMQAENMESLKRACELQVQPELRLSTQKTGQIQVQAVEAALQVLFTPLLFSSSKVIDQ